MGTKIAFANREGHYYYTCLGCGFNCSIITRYIKEDMNYCMHCGEKIEEYLTPEPAKSSYTFSVTDIDIEDKKGGSQ